MRNRNYRITAFGLMLILLLAGGLFAILPLKQNTIMVQTVKAVNIENSNRSSFSGKLEAFETANVAAKITGKVAAVYSDVGSAVKAGDTLLTLEANELAASVEQARANLEVARSSLETARIDYEVQRQNIERYGTLVEQGALAKADFDNKYALPFAKAKESMLHGSAAQVRQAEANLQYVLANYQNSIIKSPISGVITVKNVNAGELASPDVTLVSVINLDKVFVMTSIGEEKINQIVLGSHVSVKIAAVSPVLLNGTVTNIAQASNSTAKTYLVKVLIDNQDHSLKPGMFAEVLWEEKSGAEVVIPKTAIISENGKDYVWRVKEGSVFRKEVSIAGKDVINVFINAGIENGEDIVISGQEILTEGMPVTVR